MPIIKEERFTGLPSSFSLIRKDISASTAEDRKLKQVDDAKKKAITCSRDYGEFRALVDTCHLKPIEKDDGFAKPPQKPVPFNLVAGGQSAGWGRGGGLGHGQTLREERLVTSALEFVKQFGRNPAGEARAEFVERHEKVIGNLFVDFIDDGIFFGLIEVITKFELRGVAQTIAGLKWFPKSRGLLSGSELAQFDQLTK